MHATIIMPVFFNLYLFKICTGQLLVRAQQLSKTHQMRIIVVKILIFLLVIYNFYFMF